MNDRTTQDISRRSRGTVIILGGKGGSESRYRAVAAEHGYELEHYEQRVPSKTRISKGRVAFVLVMVSMISHPLMEHAKRLAGEGTSVVYLRSPSLSSIRDTLSQATRESGRQNGAPAVPEGRRAA
jgi:hypothetical protein